MKSSSESDAPKAHTRPSVSGSLNVVGGHNTVVFPGACETWDEKRAFILQALPRLSEAELAEIQAKVKQALGASGTGG